MATIKERNKKFSVIYKYKDENGKHRQKWETFDTKQEAVRRKQEIEFQQSHGQFEVPKCKNVKELLKEYVELYGKDKWSMSTYQGNMSLINNYILPYIGDVKLSDINTRYMEMYYQNMLSVPAIRQKASDKSPKQCVTPSTVRDIHKLLRSCFGQAVKWELMDKNPTEYATVPKYKAQKREIWTAETLMYALEVCEDENLKMALNLAFAGSLRMENY